MTAEERDTEKELIEQCVQGNQQAFKKLYDKISPTMYMVAIRYMNSDFDAQDVLQDGFIRIFKKIGSFRFAGSFEGWCRRIIVHTSIEHLRKAQRNFTEDLENLNEPMVNAKGLADLQHNDLLEAISKLPPGYRSVFNMYIIEGYSHKEVAEELGITVSTSKSQLFKARAYLQQRLLASK